MQKPIDAMQLNYRIAAEYRHSAMQMINPEAYRAAGDIMAIIDSMPMVDTVRHGHWIHYQEERTMGLINMIRCSECGNHHIRGTTGCPEWCEDCGARMDREAEANV